METLTLFPQTSGTEILMSNKQGSGKDVSSETTEFGFLDEFLSILITNMNPNDMRLDSETSTKLNQYIQLESSQYQSLESLDSKAFLNKLKAELSNSKPHKLSLEGLKNTIKRLLTINTNSQSPKLATQNKNENIAQIVKQMKDLSESNQSDNKISDFLQNIRKYVTKEEFEIIKKNLVTQHKTEIKKFTANENALNRFINVIEGKEEVAKNKITVKSENIELQLESGNTKAKHNISAKSELFSNKENVNSADKIEQAKQSINIDQGNIAKSEDVALKSTESTQFKKADTQQKVNNDNAFMLNKEIQLDEQSASGQKNDSSTNKEFAKQQTKEQVKQNIIKSDISELLTKTNTAKKTELKKTENIVRSNFIEKAINSVKMTKSGGSNIARIMLQPRSLGNLTMRISLVGNNVKLYIKADKSEAAEHIDRQLPLLKERMIDNGLKVEQIVIESSDSEHLADNQQERNKNEQEELRRQFVKSFGNTAYEGTFDISANDVEYYNSSTYNGYIKAGNKINV